MTITQDDVACFLHIPITRRLIEEDEESYEKGIQLLKDELSFAEEDAMKEVKTQWGAYASYTHMKRCDKRLLNKCNYLEESADEEEEEHSAFRTACVKTFLLLLVGYTIFANKNIKSVRV